MIRSLNSIYSEINEYNTKFWSKYLLSIWLIMGSVIKMTLVIIIFIQTNIIKIAFTYGLLLLIPMFLFIINTASSVNYEANKSYILLNSIMASNAMHYINNIFVIKNKFKVI